MARAKVKLQQQGTCAVVCSSHEDKTCPATHTVTHDSCRLYDASMPGGGRKGLPEGNEGSAQVGLQLAPVDPASDRVSGIGSPPQHHGGTPVVLEQGPILAQESGVRALQDLPSALRPHRPYEQLPQKAHKLVALVQLQPQQVYICQHLGDVCANATWHAHEVDCRQTHNDTTSPNAQ